MGIAQINADNPNAPEHGKGYKHENNAGCPCRVVIEDTAACKTIVQRLTRNDQSADLISEKECDPCEIPVTNICQPIPNTSCGTNSSGC